MNSPLWKKKVSTYCVCGQLVSAGESINVPEADLGEWERSLEKAGKLRVLRTSRPDIVQVLHVR